MTSPVQGHSQPATRYHNRGAVLRVILGRGPISRSEISRIAGLTPATVTHIVNDLISNGHVCEIGATEEIRLGRKSILLDVRTDVPLVAAVDIHPTFVAAGLSDLRAQILDSVTLPLGPNPNPTATLEAIACQLHDLFAKHRISPHDLLGVGVGAVGLVEYATGINRIAPHLNWRDVPVAAELEARLGTRVVVDNNTRTMALGERLVGHGKNLANLVLVNLGWGIGSGLIIRHELYRGSGDYAGEVGHITVVPDGELCTCGNHGCLETVASGAALVTQARRAALHFPDSKLAHLAGQDTLTTVSILQAARDGDDVASGILRQAAQYIGLALASLVTLFNPDMVVLAGALVTQDDLFLNLVREVAEARSYVASASGGTPIVTTSLGPQAGLRGAAAMALERFFYGLTGPEQ